MNPPPTPLQSPRKTAWVWKWAKWFIDGHYVDRQACDQAVTRMHQRDPLGDRIHLFFACAACVCLLGPQTVAQIGIAPLAVFFFVRVINTFPVWIHGFGQPVMLAALALAAWMGITLLWSGNVALGLDEIAQLRWFVLAGLIFPVIDHRRALILSLLAGYALAMLAQVIDAFNGFGSPALAEYFWHDPMRISGWFQPVVGGSIFVAGLGLVLPSALFDQGRIRTFSIIASLLMMGSILATGSRGAWIAMPILGFFVFAFGIITKRIRIRTAIMCIVIAAIFVTAAVTFAGNTIRQRADQARTEITQALEGHYDTDTGARIRMAQLALHATIEHPIAGVGAGGYRSWAQPHDEHNNRIYDHAHNTPLHLSATTGLIGFALGSILLSTILRNGYQAAKRFDSSGFALGPLFGVVGLVSVSMTDVVLVNAQTAALLGILAALSPAYAPNAPILPNAPTPPNEPRP